MLFRSGLDQVPRADWPPIVIVHVAFQVMVGVGTLLAGIGAIGLFALWKRPAWLTCRRALQVLAACTPLGFLAIEAGWVVTEVGRQPWIIQGLLRTADAVTPRPGVIFTLVLYLGLYGLLAVVVSALLARQIAALHAAERP